MRSRIYAGLAIAALMCGLVAGCKSTIDINDLIEFLADNREEIIELANQIPTPKPTATMAPTPIPVTGPIEGRTYHDPVYVAIAAAEHPVGFVLTSGHDLLWKSPRDVYGSIACGEVTFINERTGEIVSVNPVTNPEAWEPVNGADNWTKGYGKIKNGAWKGGYYYTTAHIVNDGGTNPTADGSRRGRVVIPFDRSGSWTVTVYYRATGNRGTAMMGLTRSVDGSDLTDWYSWHQAGSGEWKDGYHLVTVATGVEFEGVE